MKGQLTKSLDAMAALIDAEARTAEVIDVDHVYVVDLHINYVAKVASFVLAFGGKDSSGKLHMCPQRRESMAKLSINSPDFEKYFQTPEGNPRHDLSAAHLRTAFTEVLVPAANQLVWGMEELEVRIDGQSIYKKEKPKK